MKTILVVDELLYCRQLLAFALRKNGYEVLTAEDGMGAIDAVKKGGVDLVIMESHLPRMDGLTALRVMRANADWSALPVFMLTGAEHRNQIVQAMQVGVQAYLLKSQFDLDALLERIGKCLGTGFGARAAAVEEVSEEVAMPAGSGGAGGGGGEPDGD